MAINYYGVCAGSVGSKYDVWINVTQNSQNTIKNQSNVTVKFFVKRNDGYSDSAYNLNESQNSVQITIGNTDVINKNLKIDTRNSVSYLLASWTGDLTHSDDGKLSVPLKASFVMTSASVLTGTISATLSCTTILRKSTLSFSSATINPGGVVTATVIAANQDFNHQIIYSLGGYSSTLSLAKGILSAQITVPAEWLYAVTDSQKAGITVSINTYNGTVKMGTSVYSLQLIIPATDDYKPSFTIGLKRADNGVPSSWGEYVQGVSKLTVTPENLSYKYGAEFERVTITVGSVSIRTLPATFNLTESGDLTVTVAVRDSRGFLTVKTTSVTVQPYSPPSAKIIDLYRCNSSGVRSNDGAYLYVKYDLKYSDVNNKNQCQFKVRYRKSGEALYSDEETLSADTAIFGKGIIPVDYSVDVCFSASDSITQNGAEIIRVVTGKGIPFNIKKGGTGAAFGKFSVNENELSVAWDLSVDGNVEIGGLINSESIPVTCSDKATDLVGGVTYYPCLKGCFVRLRLKALQVLEANKTYTLAYISSNPPNMFTPLHSFANYETGGVSISGVVYKTGDIVFRSDTDINTDMYIYISGFYLADYNEI